MKKRNFLTVIFIFVSALAWGQKNNTDSIADYYHKYPQKALSEAEEMYKEALRTHDTPLLLKALIQKTTFSLVIDYDKFPELLKELEKYAQQEKNVAGRSILFSYMAELYEQYYHKHYRAIEARTPLKEASSDDIRAWSPNIFRDKVFRLINNSIQERKILQETPISVYNQILITGNESPDLRPTLYDFLCHRGIYLLNNLEYTNDDRRDPFATISGIIGDYDTFTQLNFSSDTTSVTGQILKIYQELLTYRKKAGLPAAFLYADLQRLEYAHQTLLIPDKDSLYLKRLEQLSVNYASLPAVVEVWAKEAGLLMSYQLAASEKERMSNLQHALEICENGIKQYPKYRRINLLKEIIQDIKQPNLDISYSGVVYPKEKLSIDISSKNIRQFTLRISRISLSTANYMREKNKKNPNIPKTIVDKKNISLTPSLILRDTTIQIPILQSGLYEVSVSSPGLKKTFSDIFICTSLFSIQQNYHNQRFFKVYDWKSGKPIANAKVIFYQSSYSPREQTTVMTDINGMASYSKKYNSYEVINAENPNGYINNLYGSYNPSPSSSTNMQLFTDRQIYRPGQKVLYKGIMWQAGYDQLKALNRKKYTLIVYNPQHKKIVVQELYTNKFGSFTGEFTLPDNSLNGRYTIGDFTSFTVADYKRPEFEISLKTTRPIYHGGDSVIVKGVVSSYSGVLLSNQTVNYEISPETGFFRNDDIPGPIRGMATTNRMGEFEIRFKTEATPRYNHLRFRYFYLVKATTTDEKGETRTKELSVMITPGVAKLILQMPTEINKQEKTVVRIVPEDPRSYIQTGKGSYTISRLKSPASPLVKMEIKDTIIDRVVRTGILSDPAKDSIILNLQNEKSGAYLLSTDYQGLRSHKIFYLYAPQDARPPIPTYNWVVEEKTECRPGETAKVLFGTSVKNAYVTYEIYTLNKLIQRKYLTVTDSVIHFEIPYQEEYGSQIWLNIYYVKNKHYIHNVIPIRKIKKDLRLDIRTEVFRDLLQPGQKEEWKINIRNAENQISTPTEVLAMMYDASLDQLSPYPIYFSPSYLPPFFLYEWNLSNRERPTYINLRYWAFRQKNYKVPPLRFDQLNTYNHRVYDCLEIEDCLAGALAGVSPANAKSRSRAVAYKQAAQPVNRIALDEADRGEEGTPINFRNNFQETAFFYPQLQTDSTGNVNIRFTAPEAVTTWKFILIANTPDMQWGKLIRHVVTNKKLMVRPNLPRFFRSGDKAVLKITVNNLSDTIQTGQARLELSQPGQPNSWLKQEQPFRIGANGSETVDFVFTVPEDMDLCICKISASTRQFSDGEQHMLPILPNETLITQTEPIYVNTPGKHTFSLKNVPSDRKDYRLTFEYSSNPLWYAVLALPALTAPQNDNITDITAAYYANAMAAHIARNNPQIMQAIQMWNQNPDAKKSLLSQLEQNAELKSILLSASPWVLQAQNETETMQTLVQLFDANRLQYLQQQNINKLVQLQTREGGWSWFKGMPASSFMTLNTLVALKRVDLTGAQENASTIKEMEMKALRYLDSEIKNDFQNKLKFISNEQILYLYVRSLFRDIPLGDALSAHKYYMSLLEKQWGKLSFYEKALAAITMQHYGFPKVAKEIVESLKQYAVITPASGMYWPNNRNTYYKNTAVQIHTAIMEAFQEVYGDLPELKQMQQWLLLQKQVQQWGNVPSTVDAIHALLTNGTQLTLQAKVPVIKIGKKDIDVSPTSNPIGYIKKSYEHAAIKPGLLNVTIEKQDNTSNWGGLYLQYFEKIKKVRKNAGDLSIDKNLFTEQINTQGEKELVPLAQSKLRTGDKIIVRLTLSTKRDMDFLYVQDLRAACLEPVNSISGNQWKFGTVYYQEIKDASTNLFFNFLPKGTYVIEYAMWVNQEGNFQDGIANFQSMYAPGFNAHSSASTIEIGSE